MDGQRLALIVAVDQYDNAGLSQLVAPTADAEALADVLSDPELGGFDVDILHNANSSTICERIDGMLGERKLQDLVLLHFSCHGIKDDGGELYLAATNTVPDRLPSTAVDAVLVSRLMRRSRARQVALLLDCCYGGAFERGMLVRAGGDVDVASQFSLGALGGGRGRVVITASSAMEYAFEGTSLAEGRIGEPSLFTRAVVEGIRSGEADRDHDGHVSLSELYDYVYDQVRERSPRQTPCKWEFDLQGELYVARNPRRRVVPAQLPQELIELSEHPIPAARLSAVQEFAIISAGEHLPLAAAARSALRQMTDDDSRRVSAAAAEALEQTALRLSASVVNLGEVTAGTETQSAEIRIEGGPLALASILAAQDGPVRARIDGSLLHLAWRPAEPGELTTTVRLTGLAGNAQVQVIGRAIADKFPSVISDQPDGPHAVEPMMAKSDRKPVRSDTPLLNRNLHGEHPSPLRAGLSPPPTGDTDDETEPMSSGGGLLFGIMLGILILALALAIVALKS